MYLIAGLGNPGVRYKNTRHNIGFNVLGLWGKTMGVSLKGRRFQSRNTRTRFQNQEIILLRPDTFMNLSGKSIKACVDFYKLRIEDVLVIHDDIDLPVGRVKVVRNGGHGGHKGVLSIVDHLGSNEFNRIKIGIGRPRYGEPVEEYVLRPFHEDEKEIIEKVLEIGIQACKLFISKGVESAMNHVNCLNLTCKEVNN
ncbi:MAG: aminoacyl-tRNA hydrolase [Pseudomonadota bacterium]